MSSHKSVQIGDYELLTKLGKGSFATVYKAKDIRDGKIYAIKTIAKQSLSAKQLERLKVEIAITKSIQHPGIVHLYDLLNHSSRYMLVMDYLDEGELMNKITDALSEEKAAEYILQVAAILRFCHSLGIVHRDVKFENVLCASDGRLVVSDFGLGRLALSPDKTFYTGTTLCGSPHYLAPEVMQGRYDGKKTDVYALGVMLYAMVHHDFPYNDPGANYMKIMEKARTGDYRLKQGLSDELKQLITGMLEPEPGRRYGMNEVLRSTFAAKYSKIQGGNIIINSTGLSVLFEPTEEHQEEAMRMYKRVGLERTTSKMSASGNNVEADKSSGNRCVFCEEQLKIPSTSSLPGWTNKRSLPAKTSDVFDALGVAAAALRACIEKEVINVHVHSGRALIEGVAALSIFQAGQVVMYTVGFENPETYEKIKHFILTTQQEGRKISVAEVSNVHTTCD